MLKLNIKEFAKNVFSNVKLTRYLADSNFLLKPF